MLPPQGIAALITESLVVYKGDTDADGNVGGTTLKCSDIGSASAYPDFDGNQIIIASGSYKGQARDIDGATNGDVAGTITVDSAFGGQIVTGTSFIITGIRGTCAEVAVLQAVVDNIFGLVNAILTLTETGGAVTTDGTEQNVYINNAPAGVYDPKIVQIDFTNHTATETVVVREYYRIKSGGGLIKKDEVPFAGLQDPLLKDIVLKPHRFGVQVTIEKTAGTNRDYDWEVIYKI